MLTALAEFALTRFDVSMDDKFCCPLAELGEQPTDAALVTDQLRL